MPSGSSFGALRTRYTSMWICACGQETEVKRFWTSTVRTSSFQAPCMFSYPFKLSYVRLIFLFRFLMCLRLCRLVYRIPFGTQRRCGNRAKNTYVSSFPHLLDASSVGNKRRNATLRTHREGFICKSSSYGALESVGKLPWTPYDLRMCSYSLHVKS